MNLTKDAAAELSTSLWLEIAETGDRKSNILYKWGFDPMLHDCPCCEYVYNNYSTINIGYSDSNCHKVCPLRKLWPKGCEYSGSLYLKYQISGNSSAIAREIFEEAAKLAKLL